MIWEQSSRPAIDVLAALNWLTTYGAEEICDTADAAWLAVGVRAAHFQLGGPFEDEPPTLRRVARDQPTNDPLDVAVEAIATRRDGNGTLHESPATSHEPARSTQIGLDEILSAHDDVLLTRVLWAETHDLAIIDRVLLPVLAARAFVSMRSMKHYRLGMTLLRILSRLDETESTGSEARETIRRWQRSDGAFGGYPSGGPRSSPAAKREHSSAELTSFDVYRRGIMPTMHRRIASALVALAAFLPLAAGAAARPFTGPAGWDHTVGATATPQSPRSQETWRKSTGELLTFMSDEGLSYDDSLALIRKNIADNGIKPSVDKDRTCGGQRAHEVEMTFGTTIVHQILVDNAPGLTKLTYTHTQGTPTSPDATSTITAYCGA